VGFGRDGLRPVQLEVLLDAASLKPDITQCHDVYDMNKILFPNTVVTGFAVNVMPGPRATMLDAYCRQSNVSLLVIVELLIYSR
jgi:hypothetical protein